MTKAVVSSVAPGSIAEEMEIKPGDFIVSINEKPITDLIDYKYLISDDYLEVELVDGVTGEQWVLEIEKEFDEDLGVTFDEAVFDGIRACQNRCVFCFVDQMPSQMRETLYVKDDDYRLSFLQGNFVTLTNLSRVDLDRIAELRLSPLYVSVHTTNPDLRVRMLGNKKAGQVLEQLRFLASAGTQLHTQIVLCPGVNDGAELEHTIEDLTSLWPAVQTVAVVPVGLTDFRAGLYELRNVSVEEAKGLVKQISRLQHSLRQKTGKSLVYLSDEFYLKAGEPVPEAETYDDYEQLENGVGLVRLLYDRFEKVKDQIPGEILPMKRVVLATGKLGGQAMQPVLDELKKVKGLFIEPLVIENRFFGSNVTVTGLLTGSDIIEALKETAIDADVLLIPAVMCKKQETVFLDDLSPSYVAAKLTLPVKVVDISAGFDDLFRVLFE